MSLINKIRNIFKIRVKRKLPSAGAMPQVGSTIVLGDSKIKLKYPITLEQWHWFCKHGWRMVDMRSNKRHYTCLPDNVLVQLLDADKSSREELYIWLVLMKNGKEDQPRAKTQQDSKF